MLSGTASTAAFLVVLIAFFIGFSQTSWAQDSPPGFNGTLKIHEDPEKDPPQVNNEPQVCRFHLHGFNFDAASSGTWRIASIAPTNNGVTRNGSWRADASGEWLMRPGIIPNGRYQVDIDQTGAPGGTKSANFTSSCPAGTGSGEVLGTGSTLPSTGIGTGEATIIVLLSVLSLGAWFKFARKFS